MSAHRVATREALALTCGALPLLLSATNARAAEWLLTPSASVATAYTDNPRLLDEGGIASAGAVGDLSMTLQRRAERFDLTVQPRVRAARYDEDESLNSNDQYLSTQLKYVTERSEWSGSASFTRDSTLTSELESTGLVETNRRHESITAAAGPTFQLTERVNLGAQGTLMDSHYPDARDTGLVDYQYRTAMLFSTYATTERSTLTLTAQGGELVVHDQHSRTRDAALRLTWSYQPYSLWTAKLSAGPTYVDARFGEDTGMIFDVDLARRSERWTFGASAGRNLTPTGRGVLTQRDRIALNLSRRFTQSLSAGAVAQWVRNEDLLAQPGIAFSEVEYGRLDLSLSWRFAERWSLVLGLGGATQSLSSRPDDAQTYRASLSMVWNGQTHSL